MTDSNPLLTFNGINGATGRYDVEPMSAELFSQIALGTRPAQIVLGTQTASPEEQAHLDELKRRRQSDTEQGFAVKEGVDPKKLKETGWGVIFAFGADPAIYEALSPLLKLRKSQAGDLYKEYLGPDAYRPGDSEDDFLSRHGAGPGPADPLVVPYYLLIVGDPDSIPFSFQYQLDVQYAVGRIHFEPDPDKNAAYAQYAAYARSVVEAETGSLALGRRAAIFGVANTGDAATRLSHDELALPLAQWAATQNGWTVDKYVNGDATKARLSTLLGNEAPAFLFTASHGMCYPLNDSRQLAQQGALLCQEWPGPEFQQAIPNDFFFSGDDLGDDARIFGTIAMHFACFGGGTPKLSDFSSSGPPPAIAPRSFVGRLPQRLLGHPRGGALAVIGHVERAWGWSFHWDQAGSQTEVFNSTIKRLMEGHPVGSALEYFNQRYAEMSTRLTRVIEDEVKFNSGPAARPPNSVKLAGSWTANNDARGYAVIGDPAVRLMLADDSRPAERPLLEVISVTAASSQTPAQPAPPQPPPPPMVSVAQVDFGVIDSVRAAAGSLQEAAQKIGAWLAESFQTVTTVEVRTYVSDNIEDVTYADGAFTGAKLRAVTIASLDGNTKVCVPEQDGKIDDALWKIHSDIFDKALANRVELLKTAAAAIASLVPGVKAL